MTDTCKALADRLIQLSKLYALNTETRADLQHAAEFLRAASPGLNREAAQIASDEAFRARQAIRSARGPKDRQRAIGAEEAAQAIQQAILALPSARSPGNLCEDCPPADYPTDKTRCKPCPRSADVHVPGVVSNREPASPVPAVDYRHIAETAVAEVNKLRAALAGNAQVAEPVKWRNGNTVADLVNNLQTLDQSMNVYGVYFIDHPKNGKEARPRGLSLSRERIADGRIKSDDEAIPYSLAIWSALYTRAPSTEAAPSVEKLQQLQRDLVDWNGFALTRWDNIRRHVEDLPGSDAPRMMFESLMEDIGERIDAALSQPASEAE